MKQIFFHEDIKLICWHPQGELTSKTIINYFYHIKQCAWSHQANRFTDFSQISNFILDYSEMQKVVSYRQLKLKEHVNIKSGLYCPSDVAYALSRMYQMLMENFQMYTYISRDLNNVIGFLEAPPERVYPNILLPS